MSTRSCTEIPALKNPKIFLYCKPHHKKNVTDQPDGYHFFNGFGFYMAYKAASGGLSLHEPRMKGKHMDCPFQM